MSKNNNLPFLLLAFGIPLLLYGLFIDIVLDRDISFGSIQLLALGYGICLLVGAVLIITLDKSLLEFNQSKELLKQLIWSGVSIVFSLYSLIVLQTTIPANKLPLGPFEFAIMQVQNTIYRGWGFAQLLLITLCIYGVYFFLRTLIENAHLSKFPMFIRMGQWIVDNPAVLVTVVLVFLAVHHVKAHSVLVGDTRYFFLNDDAMISMRYARNLVSGYGLNWNPNDRVEGYSNLLWVLVMAFVHLLNLSENVTSLIVMALNWTIVTFIVWQMQRLLHRRVNTWLVPGILLVSIFDQNLVFWTRGGMESTLLAGLVLLCVYALTENRHNLFLVPLSLIPLVRIDASIIAVTLALFYLYVNRKQIWRSLIFLSLAALPVFVQVGFRLSYYDQLLPNTYYLKVSSIEGRYIAGLHYTLQILKAYGILFGIVLVSLFWIKDKQLAYVLIMTIIVQLFYIFYVGGDALPLLRFIVPLVPLIYLLMGLSISEFYYRFSEHKVLISALVLGVFIGSPFAVENGWVGHVLQQEADGEARRVITALAIEKNLPPGSTISLAAAGNIPYFAEDVLFIDVLGKNDTHIAHIEAPPGNIHIAHNKFDFDYVYKELQPDLVHTNQSCSSIEELMQLTEIEREIKINSLPRGIGLWSYKLIFNEEFETRYFPNKVDINSDIDDFLGCLYARNQADLSITWDFSP